ncbi:ParB/RepB/Spo0J family partition protein [Streptomyces sp. NBC_00038]|uniref:ParB/RepB/Spo0J family partition protein n=1 Tax=Streptomyces sp. NBC_00038 TaxID=2903615 RepID=UPI002254CD28|nr:ParB/RepB/Spo0J family partition protein [Streptomyces sp. NBC_00038]MCX5559955.1 ParB/RepB/Spo0J family partition protein [Streptomyces sp. NBC_00038]
MPKPQYAYELPAHKVDYGKEVAVSDLKIDPQAQRTLNEGRAQRIADNIVPEAIGLIMVSQRDDGEKYIVDGQHRHRACQLAGIPTVKTEIHHGLTLDQEAILFLIKNRESHKPRPIDEYHVGLTGGVPLFVHTDRVLKKHGLILGSTSTNGVGAVSGVLRITERFGAPVLDRTLWVAEAAFDRSPETWDGMILGGIGQFLGRWGDIAEDKELARKMLAMGTAVKWRAEILSRSSRGGFNNSGTGSRVTTAYRLVIQAWNAGRRSANRIEE